MGAKDPLPTHDTCSVGRGSFAPTHRPLPRNTQCLCGQNAHSSEAARPPSSGLRPPSPPQKRGEKGLDWRAASNVPYSRQAFIETLLPSAEGRRCRRRMRGGPRGRHADSVSSSQARRARRGAARDDRLRYDPRERRVIRSWRAALARWSFGHFHHAAFASRELRLG